MVSCPVHKLNFDGQYKGFGWFGIRAPNQPRCDLNLEENQLGIVGAPCILHSMCAPNMTSGANKHSGAFFNRNLTRYGLREGFRTTKKLKVKQAHDAGIRFQDRTPLSIHENVVGFDEAGCVFWCVL